MKSFLPALLALTFLFLLNFLSRIIFSPLLPVIKEEMGLTNAGSGSLFLLISSGYFISILSSSYVSSYLNHKNSIFLSTFCSGAIVVCLSFLQSPVIFKWGLFGLGLAAGLYLPSALASIAHTVTPAYLARGMAVHELAPNVGFVLAPFLCEVLLGWLTWRSIIVGLGVCMMLMSLIYYYSKSGCLRRGRPLSYQIAKEILFNTKFLVLVALFSLAICSTLGIYAMLPLFLVTSHSMEAGQANNLLAMSRISSIFMPVLGGWLGDKFGHRRVITIVLALGGVFTILLGSTMGWVLVAISIVQPMISVCFFPSGFAVLAQLRTAESGSLVISLCIPFAFLIGAGILPTLIGYLGDISTFNTGFHVVGGLMVVCGVAGSLVSSLKK